MSGCDVTLNVTNVTQYITTEGHPIAYLNNQDCSFNFAAPPGEGIIVDFEDVLVETGSDYIIFRKWQQRTLVVASTEHSTLRRGTIEQTDKDKPEISVRIVYENILACFFQVHATYTYFNNIREHSSVHYVWYKNILTHTSNASISLSLPLWSMVPEPPVIYWFN